MRSLALLCATLLCGTTFVLAQDAILFGQSQRPMHIQWRRPAGSASSPASASSLCTLQYYGGPVVSSVKVVTVFWGPNVNSTVQTNIDGFYSTVTNSAYVDWLSEYDTIGLLAADSSPGTNQAIMRGSSGGTFTITPSVCASNCTVDDTAIQTELISQVNAGHLPAPDSDHDGNVNTTYMIYFPPGITITQGGSTSCVAGGFCAYHGTTGTDPLDSKNLLYGVFPDMFVGGCTSGCGTASTTFGNVTSVSSHELGEIMTDAQVGIATTFAPPLAWYNTSCGEIGDICNADQATVAGYTVQKLWSNGANACIATKASVPPGPTYAVNPASSSSSVGTSLGITVNALASPTATTPMANYRGTVHFTSSDSSAVLPSDYTYTSSNLGSHGFNVTFNTPGNQTVTATDTNAGVMTGSATVTVAGGSTTHFLVTAPASVPPTVPFNFSVSARDASNNVVTSYGGTVHFSSSDLASVLPANSTLTNGTGTFSATLSTLGTETVVATDSANSSISGQASTKVAKLGSSTKLTSSVNPSAISQLVTFTALVKSSSGTPSGTVTFKDGTTVLGSVALDVTGHASTSTSALAAGAHSITAGYSGSAVYKPSTSAILTQNVKMPTTTAIMSATPASPTYGTAVTLVAHVTSTTTPSGNVTFKSGSLSLGTGALDGSGDATITTLPTALAGGSRSLTAVYAGDATHLGSTSPIFTLKVNKAGTSTALAASGTSAPVNTSVTFTATVTSATGLTPTPGQVTFKAGTTLLGTAIVNSSGIATLNHTFTTAGTYMVKANYGGTVNFAASSATAVTEIITP
jgi:Big-like domain-containing protein